MSILDSPIDKARLGVITPLYVSPQQNPTAWIMLASVARRYPRIHNIAVVDVSRGPGLGPDTTYQYNIRMLKENNVTVLGYIESDEGKDFLKQDMKNWKNWYPEIDGFYFAHVARSDDVLSFYEDLTNYAKEYLECKFVVAEFSKEGRPALPRQLIISSHIDLYISYRDDTVPAPIESLKGGIEDRFYQAHKFGIMLTKLSSTVHSQKMVENFMRQAISHGIARYFYFHTDDGARQMHPDPFQRLSELIEVTVQDLNDIAAGEGVLPAPPPPINPKEYYIEDKYVPKTGEGRIATAPPLPQESQREFDKKYDRFGVLMINDNMPKDDGGFQEWYFKQDGNEPETNEAINELKKEGILRRMQDGSKGTWLVSVPNGDVAGFPIKCESKKKQWLNTEQTIFFKYLRELDEDEPYIVELGAREGVAFSDESVAYKTALIKSDGRTTLRKRVADGGDMYCPTRATQPAITAHAVKGKWIGLKFVVRNHHEEETSKINVMLETFVLQNCTGSKGELIIPANQNWKLTSRFEDMGYWGLENSKDEKQLTSKKCKSVQQDRKGQARKSTDILNSPGSFTTFTFSGVEMVITNLSVREIKVEQTD